MAVLGIAHAAVNDWTRFPQHLLAALVVFMAGLILFQRKFFGGGDVKMLTALSLWFVPQQLPLFIVWTMMCGGVAGLFYLARTMILRAIKRDFHWVAGVPYGIGIAGGFIVAVGQVVR